MFDNTLKSQFRSALLISLLVLGGCSKSFVVTSEVPSPLIERLPVTAKVIYTEEFSQYVYVESGRDRALQQVDFGQAQVGMFNRVFNNLLTVVEPSATVYDLKIEPKILDFQYSVPAETNLKIYEVWLKYRVKITDQNDSEIADWVVKGYGKTPTSMLGSQLKAFNNASNVSLRDVGAQLAIGFPTQPSIEKFLAGRNRASVDSPASQDSKQKGESRVVDDEMKLFAPAFEETVVGAEPENAPAIELTPGKQE